MKRALMTGSSLGSKMKNLSALYSCLMLDAIGSGCIYSFTKREKGPYGRWS